MKTTMGLCAALLLCGALSVREVCAVEGPSRLRHVVCLKFKEGTKPEDIKKAEDAFRELKTKINYVISLEWGTNLSKEQFTKGFTHCFVLTFVDEKDLEAYVKNADHQAFAKDVLGPIMDDVFVFDYKPKD